MFFFFNKCFSWCSKGCFDVLLFDFFCWSCFGGGVFCVFLSVFAEISKTWSTKPKKTTELLVTPRPKPPGVVFSGREPELSQNWETNKQQ